jgi:hypothetical protein
VKDSVTVRTPVLFAIVLASFALPLQGQRSAAPAGSSSAREAAPIDLTGYWVSVVTEDWRYRMVTPPKGDSASVPLNDAGRRMLATWDPAQDEAAGEQCRSYGVANIMRVPGRVQIAWQDADTLKIEADAGTQTRLLHFGEPSQSAPGAGTWQGYSVARWEPAGGQRGGGAAGARGVVTRGGVVQGPQSADDGGRGRGRGGPAVEGGSLKVVTIRMKAGYLRKNGVPYSEHAVVTEYFDRHVESNGEWFTVTTIVDDPTYLDQPFITSTHFRKEADGSKWRPTACTAQ